MVFFFFLASHLTFCSHKKVGKESVLRSWHRRTRYAPWGRCAEQLR